MPRTPEVVEGYRTVRSEAVALAEARPSPEKLIPAGKTVFQFVANRYRLQLTAPEDSRLPDGRILRGAKPLVIIAEEGFKVLDNVKDKVAIQMLRDHRDYRKDFWDYQETLNLAQAARESEALKTLENSEALQNPEVRAKVVALLKQSGDEDFQLPSAAKKPQKVEAARI